MGHIRLYAQAHSGGSPQWTRVVTTKLWVTSHNPTQSRQWQTTTYITKPRTRPTSSQMPAGLIFCAPPPKEKTKLITVLTPINNNRTIFEIHYL